MRRELNAVLLLVIDGLFTGVLWTLSIERIWVWRVMDTRSFATDFGRSVRRVDLVQPFAGVLSTGLAIYYATLVSGTAQTVTIIAIVLLLAVLVLSIVVGVPMQKPFRFPERDALPAGLDVERVRRRWFVMHLVRTLLGVAAFALLAVAAVSP